MCDHALLWGEWHATDGEEPKKRALIRGEPGTNMALDHPRNTLWQSLAAAEICSGLGMAKAMSDTPPDIMEECARFQDFPVHDIPMPVLDCQVMDRSAVCNHPPAAAGFPEQSLPLLSRIMHAQGTLSCS